METEAVEQRNGLKYCEIKDELVLRYCNKLGHAQARSIFIKLLRGLSRSLDTSQAYMLDVANPMYHPQPAQHILSF